MVLSIFNSCSKQKGLEIIGDKIACVHPVIYLEDIDAKNEAIDVIFDTLDRNNKKYFIGVNTYRSYWKLIDFFKSQFGICKYTTGSSTTDRADGIGKYRWNHVNAFGMNDLEITFSLDKFGDKNEIAFTVWSENLEDIRNMEQISDFFHKVCNENLFNQKIIVKPREEGYNVDRYFALQEIIKLNYDTLIAYFEKYIDLKDDEIQTRIEVNKKGDISSIDIEGKESISNRLKLFFNQVNFPIIINKSINDTIRYSLSWDFWISDKTFTERAKNLIASGTKNFLPLSSYFRDKTKDKYNIMNDDFFNIGKRLYLIRNPYGHIITFYEYSNGIFNVLYSDSLEENQFYNEMYFEDLNNDHVREIIMTNTPNMNGNSWQKVYAYNKSKNEIYCAGEFSTYETINKAKNEIYVDFGGSWYTPISRRVLGWKNGKLITKKFIERTLKDCDYFGINDKEIMEYYENPYFEKGIDTLVLKKTDWYSNKYKQLWNNFFKTD